jgi:hypothetical protein
MESQKFKHKVTGEIKTQIPILEINDYEPFEPKDKKLFIYDDCLSCGNESRLNKDGLCVDCWSKNLK